MATSPSKAAPAAQAAAPAKSKKMLFIILGVVLLLLIAGGGAAAWFLMGTKGEHSEPKAVAAKPPVFMPMDTFTVNLQMEDGAQQFLQVGMSLQVGDQASSDTIKQYMPQVRSRLLLLLSSKKASEILTTEGKKQLAADILSQLKDIFADKATKPEVFDVHFMSFVVQ